MSSILEALKKLEAEKAAKQAGQEPDEVFHAEKAEEDLVVGGPPSAHTFHIPPIWLFGGLALFAIFMIVVSVTLSLMLTRTQPAVPVAAANPVAAAAPATAPAVTPPAPAESTPPTPAPVVEPAPAPQPAKPVEAPAQPKQPDVKPAKTVVPKPLEKVKDHPQPVLKPVEEPAPEPVKETPEPVETPAAPVEVKDKPQPMVLAKNTESVAAVPPAQPAAPVDAASLPMLRSADRAKYGLENIKLNVLKESSGDRPNGLAIINLNKVYIGEVIPGTRARLIDVKPRGIGIEIVDSGERYFVQH